MPFDFKLILPEHAVAAFEDALSETAGAVLTRPLEKGPHAGAWELQAIFEDEPDRESLRSLLRQAAEQAHIAPPRLHLQKMPDINWLAASYQGFPPIEVGQYYIYGSHITTPPPADKIALKIDAATAFGTGEHQTTHGCLQALADLKIRPERVLDIGCGSGILGMAYAKSFHQPVDAVDIDPESVRVARENAAQNGLADLMTIWHSNGYSSVPGHYDLILCNILAKPLIEMAGDLYGHLNNNGVAILSGFLINQENWVQKAHTDLGLHVIKTYRINGWSTLVLQKDPS